MVAPPTNAKNAKKMKHGFGDKMVRPRNLELQQKVIQWYYANGELKGKTAEKFGIHRGTVGRWIAEYEELDTYQAERGIRQRDSDAYYGRFSMWFDLDDMEKLIELSMKAKVSISKLIVEITSDFLGVELDE